jgi:hypothetical protein
VLPGPDSYLEEVGRFHFQAYSDCWPKIDTGDHRYKVPLFLLAISNGPVSAFSFSSSKARNSALNIYPTSNLISSSTHQLEQISAFKGISYLDFAQSDRLPLLYNVT